MPFSYIVLGAGRQGTAAAYDLAKFGDAAQVILTDVQWRRAQTAADLVNLLAGRNVAEAMALDVRDEHALREALKGREVALSCVPYFYNLELARAAIAAGVSFCDLGGNTDIVRQQHALDSEAKRAGVRIVPDCGMGNISSRISPGILRS